MAPFVWHDYDVETGIGNPDTPTNAANLTAAFTDKVDVADPRLTDARVPLAHTQTASTITDFSAAADARVALALPVTLSTPVLWTFANFVMRPFPILSTDDGTTFTDCVGLPYVEPDATIGARDPSVVQWGDVWVMAYTRAPLASYLGPMSTWGLAVSTDLITWARVAIITPTFPASLNRLYAPDLMVNTDGSLWVYWAGSTDAAATFHIYCQSLASGAAWTAWSTPTLVTGPPTKAIDMTARPAPGGYLAVVKDEAASTLWRMVASAPQGPYTRDTTALPTGTDAVEGPALLPRPGGGWTLYHDHFNLSAGLFRMDTADPMAAGGWSTPVLLQGVPASSRHPSVLYLSPSDTTRLKGVPVVPIDMTLRCTKPSGSPISAFSITRVGPLVTACVTFAGTGTSYAPWASVVLLNIPVDLCPASIAMVQVPWLASWVMQCAAGNIQVTVNGAVTLPSGTYTATLTWKV